MAPNLCKKSITHHTRTHPINTRGQLIIATSPVVRLRKYAARGDRGTLSEKWPMGTGAGPVLSRLTIRRDLLIAAGEKGPPWLASGNSARMVAPTVIRTGRSRSIPASRIACSNGSPFWCISSMKSKSTITWLTMTPIRLAIPRNAMKPNGEPITARQTSAPATPYGVAANTRSGLTAFPNCRSSAP